MLKKLEVPYNQGLHRFAIFTASVTLLLIVAGALVTSNDAGLSVPDWPTTFGSFYKMPHMVGGVIRLAVTCFVLFRKSVARSASSAATSTTAMNRGRANCLRRKLKSGR